MRSTRDTEDHAGPDQTGSRPGEDHPRPYLGKALHPEEFSESREFPLEEGGDRLDGTVIMGDPGTSREDDTVTGLQGQNNPGTDQVGPVRDQGGVGDLHSG